MNRICKTILAVGLVVALAGCYADEGNYDYLDASQVMPVEIAGLDSKITVIANSPFDVKPKLTNDDATRYTYSWYVIANAWPYAKETLSSERDLTVNCNLMVGQYTLYYIVKDESLDVYRSVNVPLTVTATDITSGWYILKGINNATDVDYVSLDGEKRENLLSEVLGLESLWGKPIGLAYAPECYAHEQENEDGTVTKLNGQSVFHIASDKDLISLNASDLSVFKTLNQQFFELPSTVNFQSLGTDMVYPPYGCKQILVNNGNLHIVGSGSGRFGYQLTGDYQIHPDVLYGYFGSCFYDQKSYQWYSTDYDSGEIMETLWGEIPDFATSQMEMICLMPRVEKDLMCSAYGLYRSRVDGQYTLVDIGTLPWGAVLFYPDPDFYDLESTDQLTQATVMAAPTSASVVYFAVNNKLMMHKVASGAEQELKVFGASEKITFIKNFSVPGSFDDLIVATSSSSGYKIYRFPLVGSAGEVNTSSSAVMSGEGEVSTILYREE